MTVSEQKIVSGIPEVGFPFDVGTTGTMLCPITKKTEHVKILGYKMLMLLYTPFGYSTCDLQCNGCYRTHRVHNPRFSDKGVTTL